MKKRLNFLFCVCGPTASGKSSLCRKLRARLDHLRLSVSTTTRTARPEEQNGVEYYFVSEAEFLQRINSGQFIEHAQFAGHRYGTETRNVRDAEAAGDDLVLDIEVQGIEQLKALYPGRVVVAFVFPPSFSILVERLRSRGTESPDAIEKRLTRARDEITAVRNPGFADYLVENNDFEQALVDLETIILAERQRFSRIERGFLDGMFES